MKSKHHAISGLGAILLVAFFAVSCGTDSQLGSENSANGALTETGGSEAFPEIPNLPDLNAKSGRTFYVDGANGSNTSGDGSETKPFKTIQFAIERPVVVSGDRILVLPGIYAEAIDYKNKSIIVEGRDGADATIIEPTAKVQVVVKMYGPLTEFVPTIKGMTISGKNGADIGGILVANGHVNRCVVRNNLEPTTGFRAGIYVAYNTIVTNTTSVNNGTGVLMASHQGPLVMVNSIAWQNGKDVVTVTNSHPARIAYSAGLANSSGFPASPTNIVGNPLLTANFHLQPQSPCIGTARGGGDMGAFPFTP